LSWLKTRLIQSDIKDIPTNLGLIVIIFNYYFLRIWRTVHHSLRSRRQPSPLSSKASEVSKPSRYHQPALFCEIELLLYIVKVLRISFEFSREFYFTSISRILFSICANKNIELILIILTLVQNASRLSQEISLPQFYEELLSRTLWCILAIWAIHVCMRR
jgi:hypothetical protein